MYFLLTAFLVRILLVAANHFSRGTVAVAQAACYSILVATSLHLTNRFTPPARPVFFNSGYCVVLVDPVDGNVKIQVQNRGYEKKWRRQTTIDFLVCQ